MIKLTAIQIITFVAIVGYIVWEIFVKRWEKSLPPSDPVIRVDLVFIYPVLAILIIISIVQYLRSKRRNV